eukprot:2543657-Pyramimonas_sp.AAC.1
MCIRDRRMGGSNSIIPKALHDSYSLTRIRIYSSSAALPPMWTRYYTQALMNRRSLWYAIQHEMHIWGAPRSEYFLYVVWKLDFETRPTPKVLEGFRHARATTRA